MVSMSNHIHSTNSPQMDLKNGMPKNDYSALSDAQRAKQIAAYACAEKEIQSGMRIGVGSGSTVKFLIDWLQENCASGKITDIQCVPTSFTTRRWLLDAKLPVQSLETLNTLDITIDGADEIDADLTSIKGGGGCLLQEKIVQSCAKKFILIGGDSKYSTVLGKCCKSIPVEVVPYGLVPVEKWIVEKQGGECQLRMDAKKCFPVITENHNYILDWHFPQPVPEDKNWAEVHQTLISIPGVVETGLFHNVAEKAYLASPNGTVLIKKPKIK
ncbi:ribose 5-phosphate isomerase A (phosphoriboisomerase a) domain-containing protein [Ditylenchus destructor]|nr:ribose 5-phosphate isomerase A (phosphoriboisomerase a) domain-containing protein [Ditylenchus destructor]